MTVCLVVVVSGRAYERYARQLFVSAHEHFQSPLKTVLLQGRPGWPAATLYRYHVLLEHAAELNCEYVFLCDADMRFEAPVGEEILGEIVATQHPGFVGKKDLPFEKTPISAAFVEGGGIYYAGGFVGGRRDAFLSLAGEIADQIDRDRIWGITAVWHDESHLNAALVREGPTLTLSPSYCMPDDASGYPWLEGVERKLVALDKTPKERRGR